MAVDDTATRYTLQVTAGPTYDPSTHSIVQVNANDDLEIDTEYATVNLCVRIQNYQGLPSSSPSTSHYFSHPDRSQDKYSISISLLPKQNIPGNEVVFGNDFDRPIRDRLPPGTNYALKLVKWMIDPGLDGDPYADKPYLYGSALSSWNHFRICGKRGERFQDKSEENGVSEGGESGVNGQEEKGVGKEMTRSSTSIHDVVVEEGGEGSGEEVREDIGIPADPGLRRKFFLEQRNREAFEFEAGRIYKADFGNPYVGFNDFTLNLPGFSVQVTKYINEKNHDLRYVLKNKSTDEVYCVVLFTLILKDEEEDESEGSEESEDGKPDSEVD